MFGVQDWAAYKKESIGFETINSGHVQANQIGPCLNQITRATYQNNQIGQCLNQAMFHQITDQLGSEPINLGHVQQSTLGSILKRNEMPFEHSK